MESTDVQEMKLRMEQQQRAGLPFNPLTLEPITGANVERLQTCMKSFGWQDHRFVTEQQAQMNGWTINSDANSVRITKRESSGVMAEQTLFNASNVIGIPSLPEMLQMDDSAFLAMHGIAAAPVQSVTIADTVAELAKPIEPVEPAPTPEEISQLQEMQEIEDNEIQIGPALKQEQAQDTAPKSENLQQQSQEDLVDLFLGEPVDNLDPLSAGQQIPDIDWSDEPDPAQEHYAVTAPYWLNGLHNFEGLKQADEINRLIAEKKMTLNKESIENFLSTYPDQHKFGLSVVEKEKHEKDLLRKANQAEPTTLLNGALVRDKEGAYRPKEGGMPVIKDEGSSLKLKRKNGKAYEAAMELALAKGWKVIELSGKSNMLGQAWLEARMKGLEVVNYNPTEKDREQLAQRIAERDAAMAKGQSQEIVELRPVMDSSGKEVMANVTYSVEQKGEVAEKQAGPVGTMQQPVVTRTTARLNDVVRTDVQPGVMPKGSGHRQTKNIVDQEVREAIAEEFDMEKGGKLVEHGEAPFLHNPESKASYYATLVNEAGHSRTVWGQDLPRSIKESGAQVGDTISLFEIGRKPVTVTVDQLDGSKTTKQTNRLIWETQVKEKALAETVEAFQSVSKGTHIGPIMAIKDGMIGQKSGRDPNKLVWHDVSKLKGPVPAIGEMAEINYDKGKGRVKDPQREQELGR